MPIEPYKIYNPLNRIVFRYEPITELEVSGSVSTEAHISKGYEVTGSVSSRNVCRAYDVTITYDGPVNIGDRTIVRRRIPNYWHDQEIAQEASRITGIKNGYTGWHTLATCLSVITCTYCCFVSCIGDNVNARDRTRYNKLDELACAKMSQVIAGMIQEADNLVTERVKYNESRQAQAPIGPGNIVLTTAQFQALLAGQQAQNSSSLVPTAGSAGSAPSAGAGVSAGAGAGAGAGIGKPLTTQFQAQEKGVAMSQIAKQQTLTQQAPKQAGAGAR